MGMDVIERAAGGAEPAAALETYTLLDAIVRRRSRRFALGASLQGGGLTFTSDKTPVPLTTAEQGILAFAAAGVTGYPMADLPYQPGAGPETGAGNILVSLRGRSTASADAAHTAALFIMADDGTYMLRRPQDFTKDELPEMIGLAHDRRFTELYERSRIRLRDDRAEIERTVPYTPPFNKWSTNIPGSVYFVPITDVTALYLTILFGALGEDFAYFFYDDRKILPIPAGLTRFGKSKGGHLHDDPKDGRVGTIMDIETYILELCALEQGLMVQNQMLVTEAMGLGGFPHYGAHRYAWPQSLGFRMEDRTLAELAHKNWLGTLILNLQGRNDKIPQAVGFEIDGRPIIKPYTKPYYPSMEAAVRAFIASKYAAGTGIFRDPTAGSAWRDPAAIQADIPEYSERNIEAVISYCEYVEKAYGHFPGNYVPIRTVIAYQAHHVDTDFYDRFYLGGAYTDEHRRHFETWHPGG